MSGIHDGHRDRMREKFLNNGLKSFAEHEVLELLLFYSIPRKNTNEIAHNLIERFGGISNVFDADIELLKEVDGISQNSAVLLKMVPQLCNVYLNSQNSVQKITCMEDMQALAVRQYIGETKEILKIILLDSGCKFLDCIEICTNNSANTLNVDMKKIIERAEKYHSTHIIIMHNHPGGSLTPSYADISSTKAVAKLLEKIGIKLIDHLIVASGRTVSMRKLGHL